MPTEVRDMLLSELSLSTYAAYLTSHASPHLVKATDATAFRLLNRGAEEFTCLNVACASERDRIIRILSSVQTILRVHSSISLSSCATPASEDPSVLTAAACLETRFGEVAALSTSSLWKGACMAGLASISTLKCIVPKLSSTFVEDHKGSLFFVLAMEGESAALKQVIDKHHATTREAIKSIVHGAALGGSIELFEMLRTRYPVIGEHLPDIAIWALVLHRKALHKRVCLEISSERNRKKRSIHIRRLLLGSCSFGCYDLAKRLLLHHSNVWKPEDVKTCIRYAAANRNLLILKLLLADPECRFLRFTLHKHGLHTYLVSAAKHDHVDVLVSLFLAHDAQLQATWIEMVSSIPPDDHVKAFERFPRDWHIQEDLVAVVPRLIAVAAACGSFAIMDLLLARDRAGKFLVPGMDFDGKRNFIIESAISSGRVDVIEYLLAWKTSGGEQLDPRFRILAEAEDRHRALVLACELGQLDIVRFLLQRDAEGRFVVAGIDPACWDNTPLESACRQGHLPIVQELLRMDEDGRPVYQTVRVAARRNRALGIAAHQGRFSIVKFLLQQRLGADDQLHYVFEGVDPTAGGQMVVRCAAVYQRIDFLKYLLRRIEGRYVHPGVAVPDDLLVMIVREGTLDILRLLLKRRFESNRRRQIEDALREARFVGRQDMASLLSRTLVPRHHRHY